MHPPHWTVLIIDDSITDQRLFRHFLEADEWARYTLIFADSGAAGLALARQQLPDVILLDLQLPDLDGFSVLEQLCHREATAGCAVIMLTDRSDSALAVTAMKLGAIDYLVKAHTTAPLLQQIIRHAIERRSWERQVNLQEQRFQAAIEYVVEQLQVCFGIYRSIRNEQGTIVDFRVDHLNPAACQRTGLALDLQVGQSLQTLQPQYAPTALALTGSLFQACCTTVETGHPFAQEVTIGGSVVGEMNDRSPLTFDVRVARFDDGFVASWQDITQRKQAEESLRHSKIRFEALCEYSPIGIFMGDAEGNVTYANPACQAIVGLSNSASQGRGWQITIHPEDYDRVLATQRQALRAQQPFISEHRFIWPDRTVCWGSVHAVPIVIHNEHLGYVGIIQDITQRKQSEAALYQSEEQRRLAIDCSQVGTWDLYMATGELIWNEIHGRLLGYDSLPSPLTYAHWRDRVHPEDLDRIEHGVQQALANRCDYEDEYRILYPDGTLRWVLGRGRGFYNEAGEPIRMVGILIDISDRKTTESALKKALADKEILLREIHHRVKNNLQIISSLLQLQAQDLGNRSVQDLFRDCQNRITSMSLIHNTLFRSADVADIDLGDYMLTLIHHLLASYVITPNQVELRTDLMPIRLSLDQAIPCGLILNELVSNSLKHAFPADRSGMIHIALMLTEWQEVMLEVRDNGVGFPHGLNWVNSPSLGLSLVRDLAIEQLDGTIDCQSDRGGTQFIIRFPQVSY